MTPHYADDWLTIYAGDARTVLREMDASSVHCVVTSPPYWGLRDYGTATWSGGDEACDHKPIVQPRSERPNPTGSGMGAGYKGQEPAYKGVCGRCGASRVDSQLGLEATPEQYVANLVAVFREVKRVLRDDGTLWLNLGDSYAGGGGFSPNAPSNLAGAKQTTQGGAKQGGIKPQGVIKPKDLVGIPWRVAFALQADGWWLRSDIIWAKPNPMPESVTDRPTKSHEYLFLLSKSARYYYDADAVAEAAGEWPGHDDRPQGSFNGKNGDAAFRAIRATRNLRSVWTIATRPYPGAHFAVFPPELPERCIKAGSSERGVCPECGAPWERIWTKDVVAEQERGARDDSTRSLIRKAARRGMGPPPEKGWQSTKATTGWKPTCHGHSMEILGGHTWPTPVPATILDPFAGSGTVGLVANRLSRRAVLIDLNPAYIEQQMERNSQVPAGL